MDRPFTAVAYAAAIAAGVVLFADHASFGGKAAPRPLPRRAIDAAPIRSQRGRRNAAVGQRGLSEQGSPV